MRKKNQKTEAAPDYEMKPGDRHVLIIASDTHIEVVESEDNTKLSVNLPKRGKFFNFILMDGVLDNDSWIKMAGKGIFKQIKNIK